MPAVGPVFTGDSAIPRAVGTVCSRWRRRRPVPDARVLVGTGTKRRTLTVYAGFPSTRRTPGAPFTVSTDV